MAHELKKTIAEIREMEPAEYIHWAMYFGQIAQQKELANRKPMRATRRR